ncbi:VOC family protein [Lacibacter luteus]|uniref:VOC family protein n=1 Tax=Lacibacter luteus TaxID=2508719 RepID=A0A4V1M7A5_9BACT|nr:VOC family protein [Lacibacter luteus]RXK58958.1 VOC family protein [Lacibacter luteus]
MNLSGIILYVQDIERLSKFYEEHFHFEVAEESLPYWILLKSGGAELGLHKAGVAMDISAGNAGENNNAKLIFETEEDIVMLREKLKSKQIQVREIKTWDDYDYWLCDGVDPEGNVFQIKQKK